MSTLAINHEDQMSFSQISLEIFQNIKNRLQQPSVLQTNEIENNHEAENMQRQSNFQLKQQEKVFLYYFYDLVADYLKSSISADVKSFLFSGYWLCSLFKLHFGMPWIPPFFRPRSRILPVNQFFCMASLEA